MPFKKQSYIPVELYLLAVANRKITVYFLANQPRCIVIQPRRRATAS